MQAILVANGWLNQSIPLQPGDLLIAADGGTRHCLKQGLHPAYVIGDLDSITDADLSVLGAAGTKIIRYPTRKDYTDLELALQHAQQLGVSEILILGALGKRWDQTIANILLAANFSSNASPEKANEGIKEILRAGMRIRLIDQDQEILFVHDHSQLEIQGKPGDVVSLIPLFGDAQGITTHNLEYPLEEDTLHFGSSRGVSNVLTAENATVYLKEGLLLCTIIHT